MGIGTPLNSSGQKADLRNAIRSGEICVFYQPQVHAATGKIASVECLARWRHPERGLLTPGMFLTEFEHDEEIMNELCDAVLRTACRDALAWSDIGIAVNLSPNQFRFQDLGERITSIARESGLPLKRLELAILETFYFEEPGRMRDVLSRWREQGLHIALDDFGTGYASLSALLDLPLDKLKIDASFVQKCEDVKSASIIHAIVAVARAIGLKVTAEGVETEAQKNFLRIAGCHFLQGYLFSPPVPACDITKMLSAPEARARGI